MNSPSANPATLALTVNGAVVNLESPATVSSLIALRQPRPPFAVERNKTLVRRAQYESTPLVEGDVIEIVTLVGGG